MAIRLVSCATVLLLLISLSSSAVVVAEPAEDKQALLDFLGNASITRLLNWNKSTSVCQSWFGVMCSGDLSRVVALRLPAIGISGLFPPNTLNRLSAIQVLSLRLNSISWQFPAEDFSRHGSLTALYLQSNSFLGPLLRDWSPWRNLPVLNLSGNNFNGTIPCSMSSLSYLTTLNLSNNLLWGQIPKLYLSNLVLIDLMNNVLTNPIPRSLEKFPSWAFLGNKVLILVANASPPYLPVIPPTSVPSNQDKKLAQSALLGIILGSSAFGFLAIAILMILCCSKRKGYVGIYLKSWKNKGTLRKKGQSENQGSDNRMVFFEGCSYAFDLEDPLRASAEVLGKGLLDTTYVVALEDAMITVAVKRLKEVGVARREFEQQMEMVGTMRQENVAALRAFYCSKNEKLLVYDYYREGSVASLLHGTGCRSLDWETRLKIAIGVARGIAYIHEQNGGRMVHGNVKASNIFINSRGQVCVSEIALAPLMNQIPSTVMCMAGYHAPEITDHRKPMQALDVYSYGVLLLELLTGKSPVHSTSMDKVIHMVRWGYRLLGCS